MVHWTNACMRRADRRRSSGLRKGCRLGVMMMEAPWRQGAKGAVLALAAYGGAQTAWSCVTMA